MTELQKYTRLAYEARETDDWKPFERAITKLIAERDALKEKYQETLANCPDCYDASLPIK